jgi:hypothetical protein
MTAIARMPINRGAFTGVLFWLCLAMSTDRIDSENVE